MFVSLKSLWNVVRNFSGKPDATQIDPKSTVIRQEYTNTFFSKFGSQNLCSFYETANFAHLKTVENERKYTKFSMYGSNACKTIKKGVEKTYFCFGPQREDHYQYKVTFKTTVMCFFSHLKNFLKNWSFGMVSKKKSFHIITKAFI